MKNNISSIYIVIQSSHIGGAEKRFLELWNYFKKIKMNNVTLIIGSHLYKKVLNIENLKFSLENTNNLIVLETKFERYREFIYKLLPVIVKAPKGSIFHYPLMGTPLIHTLMRQKMIISMVNSTYFEKYGTASLKGKFIFRFNAIFAHKIDILNPKIYSRFRKKVLFSNKYSLTVGSMVDIPAEILKTRKNSIIFLGRFDINDPKNVLRYVKSIPFIDTYLKKKSIIDSKYYILGHGSLQYKLEEILSSKIYENINVVCYYEPNPMTLMKDAKVMLSLQKYENYPSRSLIEAMSRGVIPVVTNVGESLLFENRDILKYISKDFSSLELAEAIYGIMSLDEENYCKQSLELQKFVSEKHSIEAHAKYYLNLYGIYDEK